MTAAKKQLAYVIQKSFRPAQSTSGVQLHIVNSFIGKGAKSRKMFSIVVKMNEVTVCHGKRLKRLSVSMAALLTQRYTYRVFQTIQMKLILLCVWAERAVLGSAKTALKFKYEI